MPVDILVWHGELNQKGDYTGIVPSVEKDGIGAVLGNKVSWSKPLDPVDRSKCP